MRNTCTVPIVDITAMSGGTVASTLTMCMNDAGDASKAGSSSSVSVSTSDVVPSLLNRLRTPLQSELMRKQKVRVNRPPHT